MGKIAVLLSGGGRTLANIIEKLPDVEISVVISSKKEAYGLVIAGEHGIPAYAVDRKECEDTASFSRKINDIIGKYKPDLIVLAGFLSLYDFPSEYENRIMNIHPALIPAFCGKGYYGMKVHEAVWKRGVKITGCTVHFVDRVYDNGPVIIQKTCPVKFDDTPDTIAQRVFARECEAYPEAISLFLSGRLELIQGKVKIQNG